MPPATLTASKPCPSSSWHITALRWPDRQMRYTGAAPVELADAGRQLAHRHEDGTGHACLGVLRRLAYVHDGRPVRHDALELVHIDLAHVVLPL